ncbi:NADPH-dependent curcumin reductase [Alphaproteobacteria bacterium SO-S41]|nr:NADPH-dependent curcumin reductase [Alphaproteobacteria bacterium SO-S41]
MADSINRRWLLAQRPSGNLKDSDFELVREAIPTPGAGEFVVKVTHLSFDPTQRGWLAADSYLPAVKIGEVVRAGGAGEVVASNNPKFPVGAKVQGAFGWQDYCLTDGGGFWPCATLHPGMSAEHALGIFGTTGLTAYFGLRDVGQPKTGDVVLISGAAGATGSVVGQIAKAMGCTAIGIAGGKTKCDWVVETAGFDACIDYKSEPVAKRIKELAPKGVNVVFENVGGDILDAALANLAQRARVVLCGGISSYNAASAAEIQGLKNYMALTVTRSRMEGFIVLDYAPRFAEGVKALADWMAAGAIKSIEDVQEGLENAPATLRRLFEGKNFGKQLLRL